MSFLRFHRRKASTVQLHVPIIGNTGVGKTSLIVSLGYLITQNGWGWVTKESLPYYNELLPFVMKGEPMPPTKRGIEYPITLVLTQIGHGSSGIPINMRLSTEDISGEDFEEACKLIPRLPVNSSRIMKQIKVSPGLHPVDVLLRVLRRADGFVIVVDITNYLSKTDLANALLRAFGDQIYSLATATEWALSLDPRDTFRPAFYAFNKYDLHKCNIEEIRHFFDRAWSIHLRSLEQQKILVRLCTCTSVGWGTENALERLTSFGLDRILEELISLVKQNQIGKF